jgi:REP element-mobilizing transposase RayT
MARSRRRHVQQSLEFRTWGGKRKGAGRPKRGFRASERHLKRAALSARTPAHVIVRVEKDIETLRKGHCYHAFRRALTTAHRRADFRVVHLSLQRRHVHFVVEADDERALAKGMQGLQVAAAHRLNAAISKQRRSPRRGRVFSDRYHARILRTPTEVRHAINYVLNNWRHHDEHVDLESSSWEVDHFSSGPTFTGWRKPIPPLPSKYLPLQTRTGTSWLLNIGWTRAGTISMFSRPGPECHEG